MSQAVKKVQGREQARAKCVAQDAGAPVHVEAASDSARCTLFHYRDEGPVIWADSGFERASSQCPCGEP